MKRLKTDEFGQHPLTLQDFGYIEDSFFEGFKLLVKALAGNTPCILWGIEELLPVQVGLPPFSMWQMQLSEGAYWDGNEIIYHQVSFAYSSSPFSPLWRLNVDENQNVLPAIPYRNGVMKSVYRERYAWSSNMFSTGAILSSIPRLENLLKAKLGVNTLENQMSTAQNDIQNLIGNIQGLIQDLANTNQNINDHINQGGHTYKKITDRPFLYGSAYIKDPGFTYSPLPYTLGSNCKVVAQGGSDTLYEIKLPNNAIINGAYHVYGSMVGVKQGWGSGNYGGYYWNDDNDIGFSITKKDNNKFHLAVREYASQVQDIWFEFFVVDLSKV